MKKSTTYRDAGVDISAGNEFVRRIKPLIQSTFRPGVNSEIGGFGAAFSLNGQQFKDKQIHLVSSTDGVGTKLKLAFMTGVHNSVGIDLVAMCGNDIVTMGARPLFFLDYFATGHLSLEVAVQVMEGIVAGCNEADCSLIGGETAELPDMYAPGEYDLAGFTVGLIEDERIIDGATTTIGDKLIGVASSGLHSNGYSLVREILFKQLKLDVDQIVPEIGQQPLGQILLTPTLIYVKPLMSILRDLKIKGIAHITGGGLLENVPRILPDRCRAIVDMKSWQLPPIFRFLQEAGHVEQTEMLRTLNCGVGLTIVCSDAEVDATINRLKGMGYHAWVLGEISGRENNGNQMEFR